MSGAGLSGASRLQQQERESHQPAALRDQGEEVVGETGHCHLLRHRPRCRESAQCR